jgi:hypothetical protein
MKESVAIAKEADTKKEFSPTDNSIHRARNEPDRQLGSLRGVIDNITRNGGKPSVESIATELGSRFAAERAPALLALQQTHGNRYVQRVVTGIQAKLIVGQPGDKYEQEADRVAEEVMHMPELEVQRGAKEGEREEEELVQPKPLAERITPLVQSQVEEEEEEEILQTKEVPGQTLEVTTDLESHINAIRGGGQPLEDRTRGHMETAFGRGFGDVSIHTDSSADMLAKALHATAFTVGSDIFFREGEYQPDSESGRTLLGHELTHVVQQGQGGEKRLQRLLSGSVEGVHFNEARRNIVALRMPWPISEFDEVLANVDRVIQQFGSSGRTYTEDVGFRLALRSFLQEIGHPSFGGSIMSRESWLRLRVRILRGEGDRINGLQLLRPQREVEVETVETVEGRRPAPPAPGRGRAATGGESEEEEQTTTDRPFFDLRPPNFIIGEERSPIMAFPYFMEYRDPGTLSEPTRMRVIREGWATFITDREDFMDFARINAVTPEGLEVTWFRFDKMTDTIRLHPNPGVSGGPFLDRMNIGGMLSIRGLQGSLALWNRLAPAVALGCAAVLAFGAVGPGAAVTGMGGAATSALESAMISGLTGFYATFLREVTDAMLENDDPAHFHNEAAWGEIFENCVVGGITNFVAGIAGGESAQNPTLLRNLLVYGRRFAASLLMDFLGDLFNEFCDEDEQEQQIRQLRERLQNADPAERQEIVDRILRLQRQHLDQMNQRLEDSAIRNVFKEGLTSSP